MFFSSAFFLLCLFGIHSLTLSQAEYFHSFRGFKNISKFKRDLQQSRGVGAGKYHSNDENKVDDINIPHNNNSVNNKIENGTGSSNAFAASSKNPTMAPSLSITSTPTGRPTSLPTQTQRPSYQRPSNSLELTDSIIEETTQQVPLMLMPFDLRLQASRDYQFTDNFNIGLKLSLEYLLQKKLKKDFFENLESIYLTYLVKEDEKRLNRQLTTIQTQKQEQSMKWTVSFSGDALFDASKETVPTLQQLHQAQKQALMAILPELKELLKDNDVLVNIQNGNIVNNDNANLDDQDNENDSRTFENNDSDVTDKKKTISNMETNKNSPPYVWVAVGSSFTLVISFLAVVRRRRRQATAESNSMLS